MTIIFKNCGQQILKESKQERSALMLLKNKRDEDLIQISKLDELIDPFKEQVTGQIQAGQNEQPPEPFDKKDLVFPSGESLPKCWLDSDYKSK